MTESTLVNRILKALNALPHCKAIKLHGNPYVEKGTPDIHATVYGQSVWLEVKKPGEHPTKLQARRLAEWWEAGARVCVVYSIDEAVEICRSHLERCGISSPSVSVGPGGSSAGRRGTKKSARPTRTKDR